MKHSIFVLCCVAVLGALMGLACPGTASAQPDMEITASIAPTGSTSVRPNQLFGTSVVVTNKGDFLVSPYELHYYYCPNNNSTGCTYLTKQTISDALSTNQSRTYNLNVTFPLTAQPGQRYLRVIVDGANTVAEQNENNNNRYDPVTVTPFPGPDLDITSSTAPVGGGVVLNGGSMTVSFTVQNIGAPFTQNFSATFSYCTTNQAGSCTLQSTMNITDNFAQGQARTLSHTFSIPVTATAGTRYIRIFVDSGFQVTESFELNNDEFAPFTVRVINQPDLDITSATAINTIYMAPGNDFQIRYVLQNIGVALTQDFSVRFFYCTGTANATCTSTLATQLITDNYTKNQSRTYTQTLTLPAIAVVGTGYIRIVADALNNINEDSETNNDIKETIFVRRPDLYVSASNAPVGATYGAPGQALTLNFTIANDASAGIATKSFQVLFYHCPGASVAGCTQLASRTITDDFTTGQTRAYTQSLRLPTTGITTARTDYIRTFVDASNLLTEGNETNNNDYASVLIRIPELTVSASTAPTNSGPISPGGNISVSYSINNAASAGPIDASFVVHIFECPGNTTAGCTRIGTRTITDDFTPGQTRAYTGTFTIPANTTPGTRSIRFFVDAATTVVESNENNNNRYDTYTLTANTFVDLQVASLVAAPTQGQPGATISLTYTVRNAGTANAANVRIRFYFSADATITTSDTYLQIERTHTLNANTTLPASGAYRVNTTIPAGAAVGARYFGAIIDDNLQITESNEANNTASASVAVQFPPEPRPEPQPEPQPEPRPEPKPEPTPEPKPEPVVDAGAPEPTLEATPEKVGNCYDDGCPTGQVCQAGACIADPCDGVTCAANERCKAPTGGGQGACVSICACTKCPAKERCVDGQCVADLCDGVTCPANEVCQPSDGKCITDQCINPAVSCGKGRVCNPVDKSCTDDPCWNVTCPTGNECKEGQCVGKQCSNETTTEPVAEPVTEPGNEPNTEPIKDTTPDAGAIDTASPEPTTEPTPEPAKENAKNDTQVIVDTSADAPGAIDRSGGNVGGGQEKTGDLGTPQLGGGCCQTGNDQPAPWIWLLLVTVFLVWRPKRNVRG